MPERYSAESDGHDRPHADTPSENGQSDTLSTGLSVLLIDDNPTVARSMEIALRIAGHRLDVAPAPEVAYSLLAGRRYDAILLDMNFTPGRSDGAEGLACLARIVAEDAAACVVVITAHSGIRIAVAAMQAGARDFLMKPWRNVELVAKLEAARTRETITAAPAAASDDPPARLLGDSAGMTALRDLIRRVGPTRAGVTVTGRSGGGRTLTALSLHAASADAGTPPVRVDLRDRDAWARLDGATGTVLLRHPDRLDEMDQARLLDRLPANARVIAVADSLVPLGPALRWRIATVELAVPPLATRGDDAVVLARHFARAAAERFGRPAAVLTPAAEDAVRTADWPDEVRGLALAVERAVLLATDGTIDAAALALAPTVAAIVEGEGRSGFDLADTEKAMIEAALREHRHNVSHAAAALGLSRGALYRRMARHGL